MNAWAEHMDNPFALIGFAALLLFGLAISLIKSKQLFENWRIKLITILSMFLVLIGVVAVFLSFSQDSKRQLNHQSVNREKGGEVTINSPSFGSVKGNVDIQYKVNKD
ncbi:MAG: hypothetical protein P8016_14405 [Sedimentisphaerales bacterium]